MKRISIDAHAKVNLSLDVLGRLPNGYHEVRMIMQQLNLKDVVTVIKTGSGRREIEITTDKDGVPVDYRNLAYQGAQLMLGINEMLEGVHIHIQKNIPMEAGLAGGSADCAATMIAINQLFNMQMSTSTLCKLGARLGSDIPFCIKGGTAVARGTGTGLTEIKGIDSEKYTVVLCKPPQGVSTGTVYRKYSERMDEMVRKPHPDIVSMVGSLSADSPISVLKKNMINVLEYVTADEVEEVKQIEQIMLEKGAKHAMMTGSGPTVFGIFTEIQDAVVAYTTLAQMYEETFITRFK